MKAPSDVAHALVSAVSRLISTPGRPQPISWRREKSRTQATQSACATSLLFAACCFAQQPRIQNAKLETRTPTPTLDAAVRALVQAQTAPAWIGYSVPRAPSQSGWRDESSWGCSLEDGSFSTIVRDVNTPVPLEGPANMLVLLRVSDQKVQRIRTLSPDCLLDAGGLPFYWFNNVKPSESVALLEGLVKDQANNAVRVIAMTKDASANAALARLVDPSQPEEIRRSAVPWLGFEMLARMLKNDSSERVREQVVNVLARSKEPAAIPTVIQAARQDKSPRVRQQAISALARSKDPKAVRFFEDLL
jgi:hypothetical protein